MSTWYTHAATTFDPETGLFSEDLKGLVENFPAMAEGALNAPRIYGLAMARAGNGLPVATISAADTVGLGDRETGASLAGSVTTVGTEVDVQIYSMPVYTGIARFRIQIAVSAVPEPSGSGTVRLYKNGVVVYTSAITGLSSFTTRAFDLTFVNGDTIKWTAQSMGGDALIYTALSPTANDGYVSIPPVALLSEL